MIRSWPVPGWPKLMFLCRQCASPICPPIALSRSLCTLTLVPAIARTSSPRAFFGIVRTCSSQEDPQ
eukprot:6423495-Pyramimonas_sp.AAC.1